MSKKAKIINPEAGTSELREIKKEKAKDELAEYKEMLQRLQAEFENYRKRVEKETTAFKQYAVADVVNKLLPLLDSFELALSKVDKKDDTVKGFELIYAQLFDILEKQGLRQISSVGEKFDPTKHEALLQEEGEEKDIVLEELQKGYLIHDRVIRPARVKISKLSNKN